MSDLIEMFPGRFPDEIREQADWYEVRDILEYRLEREAVRAFNGKRLGDNPGLMPVLSALRAAQQDDDDDDDDDDEDQDDALPPNAGGRDD